MRQRTLAEIQQSLWRRQNQQEESFVLDSPGRSLVDMEDFVMAETITSSIALGSKRSNVVKATMILCSDILLIARITTTHFTNERVELLADPLDLDQCSIAKIFYDDDNEFVIEEEVLAPRRADPFSDVVCKKYVFRCKNAHMRDIWIKKIFRQICMAKKLPVSEMDFSSFESAQAALLAFRDNESVLRQKSRGRADVKVSGLHEKRFSSARSSLKKDEQGGRRSSSASARASLKRPSTANSAVMQPLEAADMDEPDLFPLTNGQPPIEPSNNNGPSRESTPRKLGSFFGFGSRKSSQATHMTDEIASEHVQTGGKGVQKNSVKTSSSNHISAKGSRRHLFLRSRQASKTLDEANAHGTDLEMDAVRQARKRPIMKKFVQKLIRARRANSSDQLTPTRASEETIEMGASRRLIENWERNRVMRPTGQYRRNSDGPAVNIKPKRDYFESWNRPEDDPEIYRTGIRPMFGHDVADMSGTPNKSAVNRLVDRLANTCSPPISSMNEEDVHSWDVDSETLLARDFEAQIPGELPSDTDTDDSERGGTSPRTKKKKSMLKRMKRSLKIFSSHRGPKRSSPKEALESRALAGNEQQNERVQYTESARFDDPILGPGELDRHTILDALKSDDDDDDDDDDLDLDAIFHDVQHQREERLKKQLEAYEAQMRNAYGYDEAATERIQRAIEAEEKAFQQRQKALEQELELNKQRAVESQRAAMERVAIRDGRLALTNVSLGTFIESNWQRLMVPQIEGEDLHYQSPRLKSMVGYLRNCQTAPEWDSRMDAALETRQQWTGDIHTDVYGNSILMQARKELQLEADKDQRSSNSTGDTTLLSPLFITQVSGNDTLVGKSAVLTPALTKELRRYVFGDDDDADADAFPDREGNLANEKLHLTRGTLGPVPFRPPQGDSDSKGREQQGQPITSTPNRNAVAHDVPQDRGEKGVAVAYGRGKSFGMAGDDDDDEEKWQQEERARKERQRAAEEQAGHRLWDRQSSGATSRNHSDRKFSSLRISSGSYALDDDDDISLISAGLGSKTSDPDGLIPQRVATGLPGNRQVQPSTQPATAKTGARLAGKAQHQSQQHVLQLKNRGVVSISGPHNRSAGSLLNATVVSDTPNHKTALLDATAIVSDDFTRSALSAQLNQSPRVVFMTQAESDKQQIKAQETVHKLSKLRREQSLESLDLNRSSLAPYPAGAHHTRRKRFGLVPEPVYELYLNSQLDSMPERDVPESILWGLGPTSPLHSLTAPQLRLLAIFTASLGVCGESAIV